MPYPMRIGGLVGGVECVTGASFQKRNPATGELLTSVVAATKELVSEAVAVGAVAHKEWSAKTVEERAVILERAAKLIEERQTEIVALVALETGRSHKQTVGEIAGAALGGLALVKEVSHLYPEKIMSANPSRDVTLVRTSVGVGALFTPFNSPFVLVTGKLFPALLCGNAVVLKAHELAPYTPLLAANLFNEAGVPAGVISVLQGGRDVGEMLVADPRIQLISFTGSSKGGAAILANAASRLTRVSIEAGGKNPFVVCADAEIEHAARVAVASAFVDAGQRCAAASRIIVLDDVYDAFKTVFFAEVKARTVGVGEADDYGALISGDRATELLEKIADAKKRGATLSVEGALLPGTGYFMTPTVLENVSPDDALSQEELFGPVVILYRVQNLDEAIAVANNSPYRLSSAIHTKDMQEAARFAREHGAGVTRINGPTFGSESHMPFGGEGHSGNGWREPGITALDFYSSLRQVSTDRLSV